MRTRVLLEVTRLTLRDFLRTPASVFWTYGFPVLMALSLGLAFGRSDRKPLFVAVVAGEFTKAQIAGLRGNERLRVEEVGATAAEEGFRDGRYLVVLSGDALRPSIRLDPVRPESELARLHVEQTLQRLRDPASLLPVETVVEDRPGSRYIDFLIPGLIGLNLLGAGLWGVGFNLVQMRVKNILRRLMVTPMRRSEFLVAFLCSRLCLVVPESAVVVAFGVFMFDVPVKGSLLLVVLIVLLGGICFIGLGLVVGSRPRTIETVSGLMNLVMLPMWILGGSFFSNEHFPDWVQPAVQVLPITHLNDALRAVILRGAGVGEVGFQIGFLALFGVVTMAVAVRWFRWT